MKEYKGINYTTCSILNIDILYVITIIYCTLTSCPAQTMTIEFIFNCHVVL